MKPPLSHYLVYCCWDWRGCSVVGACCVPIPAPTLHTKCVLAHGDSLWVVYDGVWVEMGRVLGLASCRSPSRLFSPFGFHSPAYAQLRHGGADNGRLLAHTLRWRPGAKILLRSADQMALPPAKNTGAGPILNLPGTPPAWEQSSHPC